jgi:hypothetical protein
MGQLQRIVLRINCFAHLNRNPWLNFLYEQYGLLLFPPYYQDHVHQLNRFHPEYAFFVLTYYFLL